MNNGLLDAYGVPLGAGGQGLTLLTPPITPTASANIDFLTAFSSLYDNVLIAGTNISSNGASFSLTMQFANNGVVDSATNYFSGVVNTNYTTSSTAIVIFSGTLANIGINFLINIQNINDPVGLKAFHTSAVGQLDATPTYSSFLKDGVYTKASTISGVRLSVSTGVALVQGKIRVYGYQNI